MKLIWCALAAWGVVTGAITLITGVPEPFVAWLVVIAFVTVFFGLMWLVGGWNEWSE